MNCRVSAAPYKIDSMDGVRPEKRAEGETASFNCQAAGNPSPSYEWYINGVSLDGKIVSQVCL